MLYKMHDFTSQAMTFSQAQAYTSTACRRQVPVLINYNRHLCGVLSVSRLPSKQNTGATAIQYLYNVDPTSSTLVQHCINVRQMFCVCWVVFAVAGGMIFPVVPG